MLLLSVFKIHGNKIFVWIFLCDVVRGVMVESLKVGPGVGLSFGFVAGSLWSVSLFGKLTS